MPSFTTQVPNIKEVGPVVEVTIMPSRIYREALQIAQQNLPQPIKINALIDTGATGTVIQEGVIAPLGINPVGFTHINTASHQNIICLQYDLEITLPSNLVFSVVVTAVPLRGQNIQCLIGRDLLSHAVFIYTGYMNSFTLSRNLS